MLVDTMRDYYCDVGEIKSWGGNAEDAGDRLRTANRDEV